MPLDFDIFYNCKHLKAARLHQFTYSQAIGNVLILIVCATIRKSQMTRKI